MDRIYVRLAMMVEPVPLHRLPLIENVCKIALTIELMRLLAVRQSFNQLFNMFVASSNLMLNGGVEGVTERELNQTTMGPTRPGLSATCTHPTQSTLVRNLLDLLKFLITHLDSLLCGKAHYETIEVTL